MPRHVFAAILAVVLAGSAAAAQSRFTPARYVSGALPAAPVLAVAGGEVFLEVLVADDGQVDSVRTLRTTPPFTDAVISAVRAWRFMPATDIVASSTAEAAALKPVAGSVLVAAMFAPPALNGPTLGQPPQDVAAPSDETPGVFDANEAAYPPRAEGDGTVLVEVTIDDAGILADVHIVVSSPAFDAAALTAARSWLFADAQRNGRAVKARAYLLFGFRQPVVGR